MSDDLLIGADPELFVRNKDTFISAYGLVPGDKYNPFPVPDGAVQVDGMALEFNIDPASTISQFTNRINSVLCTLRDMVPQQLDIVISPIASFDKKYMEGLPVVARTLGCQPDYNAYTGEPNPAPEDNSRLRTAAGHIHLGWTQDQNPFDKQHFAKCREIVKELDWTLGIPSLVYDKNKGAEVRRKMYGKAGAFRPKPYGLEYRVLSNYWLLSNNHMSVVYENARLAFNRVKGGDLTSKAIPERFRMRHGDDLNPQEIIDKNRTIIARRCLDFLNIHFGEM